VSPFSTEGELGRNLGRYYPDVALAFQKPGLAMTDPTTAKYEELKARCRALRDEWWAAKFADDQKRKHELQEELSAVVSALEAVKKIRRAIEERHQTEGDQ
jgi:hypothetical protein